MKTLLHCFLGIIVLLSFEVRSADAIDEPLSVSEAESEEVADPEPDRNDIILLIQSDAQDDVNEKSPWQVTMADGTALSSEVLPDFRMQAYRIPNDLIHSSEDSVHRFFDVTIVGDSDTALEEEQNPENETQGIRFTQRITLDGEDASATTPLLTDDDVPLVRKTYVDVDPDDYWSVDQTVVLEMRRLEETVNLAECVNKSWWRKLISGSCRSESPELATSDLEATVPIYSVSRETIGEMLLALLGVAFFMDVFDPMGAPAEVAATPSYEWVYSRSH